MTIELFLHREGSPGIDILTIPVVATVADVIAAARLADLVAEDAGQLLSREDTDTALGRHEVLSDLGIGQHHHVHLHRSIKIDVTISFNGSKQIMEFPPAATIARVKRWAAQAFGLDSQAIATHVLQIHGSTQQPSDDTHIGSLVVPPQHHLHFDLVPKKRVEG